MFVACKIIGGSECNSKMIFLKWKLLCQRNSCWNCIPLDMVCDILEGTRSRRGTPGNPGNLRVRLSAVNSYGHWVNMPDMDVHSDQVTIHGTKVNLKTGSVSS